MTFSKRKITQVIKGVLSIAVTVLSNLLCSCKGVSETLGTGKYTDDGVNISALSYDMELKLDTENDRLDEVVKMELKNNGDNDVDTLYLRYYPNGYVPFLKDSFPEENKDKKLSSKLMSVVIAGTDKTLPLEYDWNDTSVKVSLNDEVIPAGGSLELVINAWTSIPNGNSRFEIGRAHV